jgi:hypothetical protein
MDRDPRAEVEAPVRGALAGVMGRGIVLVGVVALVASWPMSAADRMEVRAAAAVLAFGVLAGYGLWVRYASRAHGRPTDEERALAWERARDVDGDDAALGLLVAGWVPVALVLAVGLLVWPSLRDPDPSRSSAWVVFGVPPLVVAWAFATGAWLDACRDDLARAAVEADRRLRHYWANVGR